MNNPSQPSVANDAQDSAHSAIDFNGIHIDLPGPGWLRNTVQIALLILALYSFIWITEDAQKRGKSGCLAFLFILAAGWPFSLLWWVWLRPPRATPVSPPPPSPVPLPPENR